MIPGAQISASCGRGKSWKALHSFEDSPATMVPISAKSAISVPPEIPRKRPVVQEILVEMGGWFPAEGDISRACRIIMIRID
jgi:hypothetical protein